MTKIIDNDRIYKIIKENESAEYPPNQVSVVVSGDGSDRYVDLYGTIKNNAVFERNAVTFTIYGTDDLHVINHTNKTIKVTCDPVQRGDSEAILEPNKEKHFDTPDSRYAHITLTITVLDVETYNKSAEDIQGFVY